MFHNLADRLSCFSCFPDNEPPRITNCPTSPIYVSLDRNGQLMSADYPLPLAIDNSGIVSWMRVDPKSFQPPHFITKDTDIVYTAYDVAGNTAKCVVQLRLPGSTVEIRTLHTFTLSYLISANINFLRVTEDTQGPAVTCPKSWSVEAPNNVSEMVMFFNESTVDVKVQDSTNSTRVYCSQLNNNFDLIFTAKELFNGRNTFSWCLILQRR